MFKKTCGACNKRKYFVRHRIYFSTMLQQTVTSKNKLCKKCDLGIKKMINSMNNEQPNK